MGSKAIYLILKKITQIGNWFIEPGSSSSLPSLLVDDRFFSLQIGLINAELTEF
jgi:hypothetical protein